MCNINLSSLLTGATSGGSWTQVVNPGNSTVSINNNTINTDGLNVGLYTFNYTVSNLACSSSTLININIHESIDSLPLYICYDAGISNIFTLIQNLYPLQFNQNISFNSSDYTLSYATGSPTDVNIDLITGDFNPNLLDLNTNYSFNLDLNNTDPQCDCITTFTLQIVGCTTVTLSITDCVATYTSDCSTNITPKIVTLQVDNNGTWNDLTTSFPYTFTDQSLHTYRIEVQFEVVYPNGSFFCTTYSNLVTNSCVATMCDDCSLYLASVVQNRVGLLVSGSLTSVSCVVGNYLIDWYFNSISAANLIFSSGNTGNTDPDIDVFHPFIGASGIPVTGGVYIPRIRYVNLNGILYSYNNYPNSEPSPDLETCLPDITVVNPSCSNGNVNSIYPTLISYNTTAPFASATRSIIYEIDASTLYVAYLVVGSNIADRFKFSYVDGSTNTVTLLEDIVVGNNVPTTNMTSTPKVIKSSIAVRGILEMPTYTPGSYLLLEIIPSYYGANNNTSWQLQLKCLSTFNCVANPPLNGPFTAGSIYMTCSTSPSCYESATPNLSIPSYELYHYVGNLITTNNPTIDLRLPIPNSTTCSNYNSGSTNCVQLNGTVTNSKVGNLITINYSDLTDYNNFKNNALPILTAGASNIQCTNNTLYTYYSQVFLKLYNVFNCGDSNTGPSITFHGCVSVNFIDAAKTISFTLAPLVNNYTPDPDCDSCNTNVIAIVNNINTTVALADFSFISSTGPQSVAFNYIGPFTIIPVSEITKTLQIDYYSQLIPSSIMNLCNLLPCSISSTNGQKRYVLVKFKFTATSVDICNNFRVERLAPDVNGCNPTTGTYILHYEVQNGIQIFP